MDFSQVRYFLALADTLNFTRAAELCHVTQPTLTQAIKRLEDELGGQLILREGKNTRLSDLGKSLRGHFEQIARTKETLKATAEAVTSGGRVELNVGLMCTIGPRILYRFLEAFRAEHPHARLILHDVTPDAIADLLLSGALDGCFLARHAPGHKKLDHVPLFTEAMVVAFPPDHPFRNTNAVRLIQVARERYVDRLHCEFRDEFNEFCAAEAIELDVAFTSQREDWIQNMIRDGAGVTVLPEYSLVPPSPDHRPIVEPVLHREVEFATVLGGPKSDGLQAMVELAHHFRWHDLVAEKSGAMA